MKSINHVLTNDTSSPLAKLLHHSQLLHLLEAQLHKQLPLPLRDHCRVANIQQDCLVVHTDAAVWATQLRFMIPTVLRQFPAHPARLNRIQVKVKPNVTLAQLRVDTSVVRELSPQTVTLLEAVADSLVHSGLQAALLRLAGRRD